MKYVYTFFFFLVFSLAGGAQSQKEVIYKCIFNDTLTHTAPMPDHILRDLASQAVQSKDLPDSLIGMFDSALRKAISFGGVPTQLRERKVEAGKDTTTVVMSDDVVNLGLNQTGGYKMMKIVKGRKIVAVYGDDNQLIGIPPYKDRDFKPTGETKMILSYLCKEYVSFDKMITIWITTALPSWINPGVSHVNIEGAILSFSIDRDGGRLVSTLEKLELMHL